jgi:NAD(P)-dependent dehydrogenase (short-subunit alcohol dehydrogenase family)
VSEAPLQGRVALVTGGGAGIGFALAAGLARRGAAVLVSDLRGAEDAAARLRDEGLAAQGITGDVTSEESVAAMVATAEEHFGGLDILINNAGIYAGLTPKSFEELNLAEWRRVLDVNVIGTFLCCRGVLPAMQRRGGGRIVNISSGVAFKGNPYMAHYVASKGAVVSLTRALATEMGRHAVLVNSVAPGFTLSENVLNNPTLVAGVKEPSLRNRVIARDMMPGDLVGAVCFFAGPDSAFITGQTLVVDGGAYYH